MIYLLSQMILALAVAIVLGAALGWLIHRTTYSQKNHRMKQTIAALKNRLAQAQSEVAMLTDDYDEMQRQSQDQINALRDENRQIPVLDSNLEKSQLLVRQMMQRHEAKVRELSKDNQQLLAKLAQRNKQESHRDNENAANASRTSTPLDLEQNAGKPALFAAAESDADPFDQVMEVADDLQRELDMTAQRKIAAMDLDTVSDPSLATQMTDNPASELNAKSQSRKTSIFYSDTNHDNLNPEATKDDTDATDVSMSEQTDMSQSTEDVDDLDNLIALDDVGEFTDTLSEYGDTLNQTSDMDDLTHTDSTPDEPDATDSSKEKTLHRAVNTDEVLTTESSDVRNAEGLFQLDGSSDDSTLFDPVNQHDDLQQIFGIGPLTEKALNDLGITSYSQLAELKQQEIQRIADALEIGPGRIERDNWVGNARRQLEDVLEQL